jgi:DNA-binding NtrC family response regulator
MQAMASNHFTSAGLRQPLCEVEESPGQGFERGHDPALLGESAAIRRLRSQLQRIAPYFRTALIRGEIGSGKQMVARYLHACSPGAGGPFIVTSATALAESFAGEVALHPGATPTTAILLESAHGGTLYLKGVGELSSVLQAALLRFIGACEERRVTPAPAGRSSFKGLTACESGARAAPSRLPTPRVQAPRMAATRILAASDRDLRMLSAIGQFRQDLYARLAAVEILVPPLRQRVEDIPVLAAWLLHRLAEQTGRGPRLFAESTLTQLQGHLWPNNLRELERVVAQAAALAEGELIEPRHLLALIERAPAGLAATPEVKIERLHDVVHQHVLEVLTRCGGNKLRAAELLGISRSTLYRMLDAGAMTQRKAG